MLYVLCRIVHLPKTKKSVVTLIGAVAFSLVTQTVAVHGRAQEPKTPTDCAFEVVSVKSAGPLGLLPPRSDGKQFFNIKHFRYTDWRVTATEKLNVIIREAYSLENFELVGPSWIDSQTYEISATMPSKTSKESARLMLRTMLAERFGLKFHHEKREIPVYALIEGKHGFKLREAADPRGSCEMRRGVFIATGTLDGMAAFFHNFTDRPVLNMTGRKGTYHVELQWTPEDTASNSSRYDPVFWEAVERDAGLKLEKRNVPRDVIVVDHVEREPTPN